MLRKAKHSIKTSHDHGGEPIVFKIVKSRIFKEFYQLLLREGKKALEKKEEIQLFREINDLLGVLTPDVQFDFKLNSEQNLDIKFYFTVNGKEISHISDLRTYP
jgi:hypothetical protein